MAGLRVGGLASGMDIDSIVADLMKAERMPLDKLQQKKQTLEWQRDDYRAMNTLLLDFRSELTQMKLSSKYRARTTSSTDETKLTATATGSASQSSVTVSKVTQLASSERLLNGGKVNLDAKQSLYSQTSAETTMWKQGVVETKSITADGTTNPISLGITDKTLKDVGSWSVSVNGKSYKVVTESTDLPSTNNPDDVSKVYIDQSGKLQFSENIAKDSVVKVDYIAETRKDTLKLSATTSSLQLSRGSINQIGNQQITVTRSTKAGDTETTLDPITFQVDTTANANGLYNIKDGGVTIGTLDKDSGRLSFNDPAAMSLKGYLPPEKPEEGKVYNYNLEITYDQNYTNFSIDTVTSKGDVHQNFLVQGNETISSLTSRVSSSNAGVTMFYDEYSGMMSLTRQETGKFNDSTDGKDITTSGDLLNNILKFGTGTVKKGTNAEFVINGISTQRNSNTFTIDGVSFTLKKTFGTPDTDDPITVNVNNDSTTVFDNIKAFVEKYNELIDKIQKKVGEERYRSYTPLTDLQREQLTDKQQEQWEEKAKSGLLRRDTTLTSLLSEMRMDFYTPVSNDNVSSVFNQLAKIGIKTTSNYLEGGKLEINEAELKKAIEADPTSVENLFRGEGTGDSQRGVVQRLYDTVTASMDKLKEKAGNSFSTNQQFTIGRNLNNIESQIDRFEDRLTQIEDRYWRQFTAMEKAIQQANSQSAYLMQQFSF